MTALTVNYQNLVRNHDNQVTTTSKIVADTFGKMHKHVLAKIDEIIAETPVKFNKPNFRPIEVKVKVGFGMRAERAYELTKDGFMLLVMGFTGKKAMAVKIEFINAFNWMAEQLQRTDSSQRKALVAACTKYCAGSNMSISEVYTMVANHFGYDKPVEIPAPLLPEAVAYVYEALPARKHSLQIDAKLLYKAEQNAKWRYKGIMNLENMGQTLGKVDNLLDELKQVDKIINELQKEAKQLREQQITAWDATTQPFKLVNIGKEAEARALERAKHALAQGW